jgi:pimeloyl-ACP methyl ester carboxylesterase
VYPQLQDLDFTTQAVELSVPVYFFVGRQDVNAMASLVERYYDVLQAPHKELIWFENNGHGLNQESMKQFVDVMVNTVLAQTQPTIAPFH